jgi:hypothetical protein
MLLMQTPLSLTAAGADAALMMPAPLAGRQAGGRSSTVKAFASGFTVAERKLVDSLLEDVRRGQSAALECAG